MTKLEGRNYVLLTKLVTICHRGGWAAKKGSLTVLFSKWTQPFFGNRLIIYFALRNSIGIQKIVDIYQISRYSKFLIFKMSWGKYSKKYKKDWENIPDLKNWISGDGDKAFCKICQINLRPQLFDLRKHSATEKHLFNARSKSFQPSVSTFKPLEDLPSSKKKILELRVALHSAVSSSFRWQIINYYMIKTWFVWFNTSRLTTYH